MYLKKILIIFLVFILSFGNAFAISEIKAENNAYRHNNKGLIYLKENYYFGAIREFQIAINLMPNAQGSAVYYVNLAATYEKIGYTELALPNYEKALKLSPLYFDYYYRLALCYKKLGMVDLKLKEYNQRLFNPLNKIMIGLLYIQQGNIATGITYLDNFCNEEPELIVTQGVREYLDKLVNNELSIY